MNCPKVITEFMYFVKQIRYKTNTTLLPITPNIDYHINIKPTYEYIVHCKLKAHPSSLIMSPRFSSWLFYHTSYNLTSSSNLTCLYRLYDIFGDSDRPLVKEDLSRLKYMERVIKESLRLYPPAPFIIRKVLEDTKLCTYK